MALTPEEKRARDRARQAAYRENKRKSTASGGVSAKVTPIGSAPKSRPKRVTKSVTVDVTPDVTPSVTGDEPEASVGENLAAVDEVLESLNIPLFAKPLAAQARTFARGLDDRTRVAQHAGLGVQLRDVLSAIEKATKTKKADPLDARRTAFYGGRVFDAGSEDEAEGKRA